ncbi:MAG: SecDF P1 head subdomain-containing protein [Nitrososphaerota archaeon]
MPAMRRRWDGRYLALISLLMLSLLLVACSAIGQGQPLAPRHTLARDGGVRLTMRASCLPSAPTCNLAQQRAAAVGALARRIAQNTAIKDAVVRAEGAADIVAELPGVTQDAQAVSIAALLTNIGARVEFLDAGGTSPNVGANVARETCAGACDPGLYRVMFTGDQVDAGTVRAVADSQRAGTWVVAFEFTDAARQQFASYTESHIGQDLTITVNDVVVWSAAIQAKIDGLGQISGLTEAAARQLASDLKAGFLPVALTVITTEFVTTSGG